MRTLLRLGSVVLLLFATTSANPSQDFPQGVRRTELPNGVVRYDRTSTGASPAPAAWWQELWQLFHLKPVSKPPFGRSVAFIAGVSKYGHLQELHWVNSDLTELRNFLLTDGGFDTVLELRDDAVRRDVIEDYLFNKFSNNGDLIGPEDRLMFFYSGHGADQQGQIGYLQFKEAVPGNFAGNYVLPLREFTDWARVSVAKHLLIILDACASGLAVQSKGDIDPQALVKSLSGQGSGFLMTAGRTDQKAYEIQLSSQLGYSVLTHALLQALKNGQADHDNTGFVTITELYSQIQLDMKRFQTQEGKTVDPQLWPLNRLAGSEDGTFVFLNTTAKNPRPLLTPSGLHLLSKADGNSEERADDQTVATQYTKIVPPDGINSGREAKPPQHEIEPTPPADRETIPSPHGSTSESKSVTTPHDIRTPILIVKGVGPSPEVAWSPDGRRLITTVGPTGILDSNIGYHNNSSSQHTIGAILDATDGHVLFTLPTNNDNARFPGKVSWSPDGTRIVTECTYKDQAQTWDAALGENPVTLHSRGNRLICHLLWSPDGTRLASAGPKNEASIFDAKTGKTLLTLHGSSFLVESVAWSPDGKLIATSNGDGTVQEWDASTGRELIKFGGGTNGVSRIAWSPDGKEIAGSVIYGPLKIWDSRSGKEIFTLDGQYSADLLFSWSPNGNRLVIGRYPIWELWDASAGKLVKTLGPAMSDLKNLAWSPDGSRVALGTANAIVRVWETTTGNQVAVLNHLRPQSVNGDSSIGTSATFTAAHPDVYCCALAWGPDSTRLATSAKNILNIWDLSR